MLRTSSFIKRVRVPYNRWLGSNSRHFGKNRNKKKNDTEKGKHVTESFNPAADGGYNDFNLRRVKEKIDKQRLERIR